MQNTPKSAQSWIFGGEDYSKVQRQGDIAVVPITRRPKGDIVEGPLVILKSQQIQADEIRKSRRTPYALNPTLLHLPGVHPEVRATGWHKVIIGQRAQFWDFASETID